MNVVLSVEQKDCVKLVDIELNAGFFVVHSDAVSFILILMYTLSSLKIPMVPW